MPRYIPIKGLSMEELSIRKADAVDSDFVFAVKKAAFREYMKRVEGWDDTHQRGLHNKRFDSQDFRIIQFQGNDIGFFSTSCTSDSLKVHQFFIHPEYQGRGIGAVCMTSILADANVSGKAVNLQVLKINIRGIAFYQRLGFSIVDEDSTHVQMKKLPALTDRDGSGMPHPAHL
ncbi:MAG: GNAT family N-acetyltransferase [Gemmatimonadota bacterium]|nr:GNAT family N-acetyltransferase [Gemmatimonadota bacterium]